MRSLLLVLAVLVGSSKSGACRFREAAPDDLVVLHARSCARKTPPPTLDPRMIERIVQMRESPPEHFQRVPGPKALLSDLPRDPQLQARGAPLPRSTRTSLQDPAATRLHSGGANPSSEAVFRHVSRSKRSRWISKTRALFPPIQKANKSRVVEVLNFVDAGTSILLSAQTHQDFHARSRLRGRCPLSAEGWPACHAHL